MTAVPPRARALLLAGLFAAQGISGCLLAEVPALFGDPPVVAPNDDGGTVTNDTDDGPPAIIHNMTWQVNDTWVWEGTNGMRVTDQVVAVRNVTRVAGNDTITVRRYDVRSIEELGGAFPPITSYHTYEPDTLGVVNSSGDGATVTYVRRDGSAWRNIPLAYVGTQNYTTSFNFTRGDQTTTYDRDVEIIGFGEEVVHVKGGAFETWHVGLIVATARRGGVGPDPARAQRWLAPDIGNDVRYTSGGHIFELVAYRAGDDPRPLNLPALPKPDDGWQTGWRWVYRSDTGFLTRFVDRCDDSRFWACRNGLVHDPVTGRDLFAYATVTSDRVTNARTYQLDLVPPNDARPVNSSFAHTQSIKRFVPHFRYDPAGLPLDGRAGTFTYQANGIRYDGVVLRHTVEAVVTVGSPRTVDTVYGPVAARDVWANLTYTPNGGGDGYTETHYRVWSEGFRNDVLFKIGQGGNAVTYELDSVRFGDGRKSERDI